MNLRKKVSEWKEERTQYKALEQEAYEAEKIEVKKEQISKRVDKAVAKGKAKAQHTGLPGPRVSPETKKAVKKGIKSFGKKLVAAAEKQHEVAQKQSSKKPKKSKPKVDQYAEFQKRCEKLLK